MDGSLILFNLLNPPVLFFFLGMIAVFTKSDLEIPAPLPKLFSLYLLISIGFKGGHELAGSGIDLQIAIALLASVVMACLVPIYTFCILKTKLNSYNAAIAVPAAMRMTVPEANPSLYVSMALALTFPFNIIVGIPLYLEIIKQTKSSSC